MGGIDRPDLCDFPGPTALRVPQSTVRRLSDEGQKDPTVAHAWDLSDAAVARHQKHVGRLDGGQGREREAVRRDRLPSQRSHSNVQVGRAREKLVRASEVGLGHAVVHRQL